MITVEEFRQVFVTLFQKTIHGSEPETKVNQTKRNSTTTVIEDGKTFFSFSFTLLPKKYSEL
jgi:hypothetical protein